jgi:hypothetical protein
MSANYSRMPGPGDLPGDSLNPNSPDYVDPLYGEEQAEDDVAFELIKSGEVSELVADMRALLPVLRRIKEGREIPQSFRTAVVVALDKAVVLQGMVNERLARWESAPALDSGDEFDRKFDSIFGTRRTA